MTTSSKYLQAQNFTLYGAGVSVADTTLQLSSFLDINGTQITMSSYIGSKGFMTLEPGSRDQEEQISFTGITQNSDGTATLTGIKTVLFNSPYTETSGFAKSHPGGVVAVLSNTSGFYNRFTAKDNDEVITGYWTVPDPVNVTDIANREWVLSVVNGGAVSQNAVIITGTAGETVAAGNLIYFKAADGRWWKTDADTASTIELIQIGIAQGAGTAGNTITGGVLVQGIDTNQSGLAAGTIYYASNTAGGISSSVGTTERVIGQGVSATSLLLNSQYYYTPLASQKAALAGSSGTLSSTNKYVTEVGIQRQTSTFAADAGSTDDYAITLSPVPAAYITGMRVSFTANTLNTGAATINVNSLGAKTIKKFKNVDLETGDIKAGQLVDLEYNGTVFEMQSMRGSTNLITSVGTATINTIGEQNLVSVNIPGNTLSTLGGVRVRAYVTALTTSAGGGTLTFRFKYGATTITSVASVFSDSVLGPIEYILQNNAATNAQIGTASIILSANGTGSTLDQAIQTITGTGAEDSTADKTLAVSVQFSAAGGNTITVKNLTVERLN